MYHSKVTKGCRGMPSEGGKPKGGALVQHERDKLKSAADDLSFFFFLHLDDRWI